MKLDLVDEILKLYDIEIWRLSELMASARVSGDVAEYTKLSERHDELIHLFYGTIDIINRS